jgi:hypothetical protein
MVRTTTTAAAGPRRALARPRLARIRDIAAAVDAAMRDPDAGRRANALNRLGGQFPAHPRPVDRLEAAWTWAQTVRLAPTRIHTEHALAGAPAEWEQFMIELARLNGGLI